MMMGFPNCRAGLAFTFAALVSMPLGHAVAGDKKVFASNYPLAYFAERIGGNPEIVQFPTIAGDPAYWKPSVEDVLAMQEADVILLNGAGYEKWSNSVSLPKSRTIDTAAGFRKRHIISEAATTHTHGSEGEHTHGSTASTTWIDFSLAIEQAQAVHDALLGAKIASEAKLNEGFESLQLDLRSLDHSMADVTSNLGDTPIIGSHPVYQYLARRYGLSLRSVHWEPDIFPSPEMWADFETLRRLHPARWMIWEGPPLAETVEKLESMGVRSIVIDPAGNRPESGDFMTMMKANIDNIRMIGGSGI